MATKEKTIIQKKKSGGQEIYSKELVDEICFAIANSSYGLSKICKERKDLPARSTILRWLNEEDKQYLRDQYVRAKEMQAEMMGDEILEIADDGRNDLMTVTYGDKEYERENKEVTGRSKIRIETRKWLMSKMLPKKYGEKLDITSDNKMIPAPQIIVQKVKE